jgi:hypothetical protein
VGGILGLSIPFTLELETRWLSKLKKIMIEGKVIPRFKVTHKGWRIEGLGKWKMDEKWALKLFELGSTLSPLNHDLKKPW